MKFCPRRTFFVTFGNRAINNFYGTDDYAEINAELEEKSFINQESYLTIEFSRNTNSTIPVKCIASNDHGTDVRTMKASYENGLVQIIESESDEDDINLSDDESWKSCVCANNGIDFSVYKLDIK
uniref:Uncharacterized protein n=1 Tax=Acrobeloides nanus TaxID=290746 RepID=A0A914CM83_9BILA